MKNIIALKKVFASTALTSLIATLLISTTVNSAFAAGENPITNTATSVTINDATLNATNGTSAAGESSFWVSTSTIVVPVFPGSSIPSGVYSTPVLGAVAASANFSSSTSIVTTAGYPSNMPAITPGTTYYYVAWSNVGGNWYPGAVQNFTTSKVSQTVNFSFASTTIKYGDANFPITATSDSALPVTVTSGTVSVCSVSGFVVEILSAGTCTLNANQAGNGTYDAATQVSQSFTIGKKDITIAAGDFAENTKSYDSTTESLLISTPVGVTFSGVINGDDSTALKLYIDNTNASGTLSSKNASTTPTIVTFTGYILNGSKAFNYNLINQPVNETQTIAKRNITVMPSINFSKVYDTNTSSTGTPTVTAGALQGADTVNFTQSFSNSNAGTGKTITATGTINDFNSGNNYSITFINRTDAAIVAKEVTVSALSAQNKIYDATTNAIGTGTPVLAGVHATDTANVNVGGSIIMNFANPFVGNSKTVNVSGLILNGTSSANYSIVQPTLSANIDLKDVTVTGLSATSKTYDSLTNSIISGVGTLFGVVFSDNLNVTLSGSPVGNFINKNIGTNKLVNISGYSVNGSAISNYNLVSPTSTATITAAVLNVTASATSKIYDATTTASVTYSDNRIMGDVLTVTGTANFDTKNASSTKIVTVKDLSISGADSLNYSLFSTTTTALADITRKDLTVTATSASKIYDSNTVATSTLSSIDKIIGDNLVYSYATSNSNFTNKNVGVAKIVTTGDITVAGTDASNYNLLNSTTTSSADINARDLVVTSVVSNKVYDGITAAAVISLSTDKVSGDVVGVVSSLSSNFDTKNASNLKLVTTNLVFANGADNSNYNLPLISTTTANITKRTLNMLSASGTDKVYDGSKYGFSIITDDRIAGDVIDYASTTSEFEDENASTTKSITISGISINGLGANNYVLALPNKINTAQNVKIIKKAASITAENKSKAYGSADPSLTATTTGLITGELLTGSLVRVIGENVGTYDINQGTLNAGNNYLSTFSSGTFTIVKAIPTLVITPTASKYTNSTSFNIMATTTSNLAITFLVASTSTPVCTITGNAVSMVGATGTCDITASIVGDSNYLAASATASFSVLDAPTIVLQPVVTGGGSFGGSLIASNNVTGNNLAGNQALQVLGANKFKFNKNLKLGMKNNNEVKELQKVLSGMGLYMSTSTSGNFDTGLFNAVKAYQKNNKILSTGFFGPKTRAVINK